MAFVPSTAHCRILSHQCSPCSQSICRPLLIQQPLSRVVCITLVGPLPKLNNTSTLIFNSGELLDSEIDWKLSERSHGCPSHTIAENRGQGKEEGKWGKKERNASVPEVVRTWLRLFLPEGCLLCCPALLMSWRAGAGCCCVHWRLPSAAFPAHHSFVCQKERRGEGRRSGIIVVKRWGREGKYSHHKWKHSRTDVLYFNKQIYWVCSAQTGLLTWGMSLDVYFNIQVIQPVFEGRKIRTL